MGLVTGSVIDFGFASLGSASGRIIFRPNTSATGTGTAGAAQLLSTRRLIATPDVTTGVWSIDLYPNTNTRPVSYYTVSVEWLDSAGNYIGVDYVTGVLVVPENGGNVRDLLRNGIAGTETWIVPGGAIPSDSVPGDLLFDPLTSDLFTLI